jgi:nitroreductase
MPLSDSTIDAFQAVSAVIRNRKTSKVFGAVDRPPPLDPVRVSECDRLVRQAIDAAGNAPFHFDRRADGLAEPWRVHWLRRPACLAIAGQFREWFGEVKPGNKMPSLLAACGCVVLVTWIPQSPAAGEDSQKLAGLNEEHLAATAAYVQNLLLLLEAAGLGSYWSTGNLLRTPTTFTRMGISHDQQLLACVFVDYASFDAQRPVERAGGGQREKRSPSEKWTREVELAAG